jgi:hypothetical protein
LLSFRLPLLLTRLFLSLGVFALAAGSLLPGVRADEPTPTAGTSADAPAGGGGIIPNTDVNPYGANIFLHKEVEQVKIDKTLQMAKDAGLTTLKQEFPWDEIEFKKGYFHDDKWDKDSWAKFDNIVSTAEKYGITLVARIDHAPAWARPDGSSPGDAPKDPNDLADFVASFLQHYNGRIKYIQVWNEPNLHNEWADAGQVDPAGYAALLKAVYTRAKATDPNVLILSAPLAITLEDWPQGDPQYRRNLSELVYWDELYNAGAKDSFDILSANAYGLDQPPDAAPSKDVLNFRRVELLHDIMVEHGDGNKAVWFNEYGWNASPTTLSQDEQLRWRRVDPATQAQYTVDGIAYAREHWPWAGVFFIWYLRQVGDIAPDKAEYYFQMLDPDFNPQPVYDAVKAAATGNSAAQATATAPAAAEATPTTEAPGADITTTPAATRSSTITPGLGANAGSSTDNSALTGIIALVVLLLIAGAGIAFWWSRRRA